MARSSTRGLISSDTLRRVGPIQFFQETLAELRKSVWPTREETARLTWIVILISAVAAFLLAGLDFVLGQTFGEYILR